MFQNTPTLKKKTTTYLSQIAYPLLNIYKVRQRLQRLLDIYQKLKLFLKEKEKQGKKILMIHNKTFSIT